MMVGVEIAQRSSGNAAGRHQRFVFLERGTPQNHGYLVDDR